MYAHMYWEVHALACIFINQKEQKRFYFQKIWTYSVLGGILPKYRKEFRFLQGSGVIFRTFFTEGGMQSVFTAKLYLSTEKYQAK
jgi:hypothetical protein